MLRSAKLYEGRNVVRFALVAVSGLWLTGCSSDASRFNEAFNQPFHNPFESSPPPGPGAAPTPSVTSRPLAANSAYQSPVHPNPVASAPLAEPAPVATGAIRGPSMASTGGAGGWTAVGGSPVLVIQGDTSDSLARRYGVPPAALLGANGLKSSSQVHPGMHIIVPVYNAHGVASNAAEPIPTASERSRHKSETADASDDDDKKSKSKARSKVADNDDEPATKSKSKKKAAEEADAASSKGKKAKSEDADAAPTKGKKAKTEDADASPSKGKDKDKTADAKSDKKADKQLAKADKTPPETTKVPGGKVDPKMANVDNMPTARTSPSASTDSVKTASEADDAGANPEFRWPARGRIIQGFKSGGNDGINISVPEGTSVRAAESGVVAYAGSELKGYGNLILIRHPNGFVTAYANNGELGVKRGEQVKRGQVIAKSGESGNVSAPQLHFELRDKAGQPVDPTNFLAGI